MDLFQDYLLCFVAIKAHRNFWCDFPEDYEIASTSPSVASRKWCIMELPFSILALRERHAMSRLFCFPQPSSIAALAVALTASVPAHAETLQELLRECASERGAALEFHCLGYIGGIGDAMLINGIVEYRPGIMAMCSKTKVTHGAMKQAVINWANRHPERWGGESLGSVAAALQETWPCTE